MLSNIVTQFESTSPGAISSIPVLDYGTRRRLRNMRKRKSESPQYVPYMYDNCLHNSLRRLHCENRARRATKIGVFYWSLNTVGLSNEIAGHYMQVQEEHYNIFGFMQERSSFEDPVLHLMDQNQSGKVEMQGLSTFLACSSRERVMRQFVAYLQCTEPGLLKAKAKDSFSKHVTVPTEILAIVENAWANGQWGSHGWEMNSFAAGIEPPAIAGGARKSMQGQLLISATRMTIQPGSMNVIPGLARNSMAAGAAMVAKQSIQGMMMPPGFETMMHQAVARNSMQCQAFVQAMQDENFAELSDCDATFVEQSDRVPQTKKSNKKRSVGKKAVKFNDAALKVSKKASSKTKKNSAKLRGSR